MWILFAEESALQSQGMAAVGEGNLGETGKGAGVDHVDGALPLEISQEGKNRPLLGASGEEIVSHHVYGSLGAEMDAIQLEGKLWGGGGLESF